MRLLLLLIVTSPAAALLWSDPVQRPLAWYLISAALLAGGLGLGILWAKDWGARLALAGGLGLGILWAKDWGARLALAGGLGLQLLAFGCGVSTAGGACDRQDGLPHIALGVLVVIGLLAEAIHRWESRTWRRRHTPPNTPSPPDGPA